MYQNYKNKFPNENLTFSAAAAAHVTLLYLIDLGPDRCVVENFKEKCDFDGNDLL